MALNQIPSVASVITADPNIPPFKFAYVIDGKVVMILNTDAKTAAIITSEPTIVQVDNTMPLNEGYLYDGTNFILPSA